MFESLTAKFEDIFRRLKGRGVLTPDNIREAMREVRRSLLEADVNFKVVKTFITRVEEKAVNQEVLKSITPGQQVVKVVADELTALMGGAAREFKFDGPAPHVLMLAGLQGSGKTTLAAKLARYFSTQRSYKPLLVAADIYRPAAVDQLRTLGRQLNIEVFSKETSPPLAIIKEAIDHARLHAFDLVILDTAGRLHIDEEMMAELRNIREAVKPEEIFFVADAMTGQDAVNVAQQFHAQVQFTGVVLTKMDGDARGGAALSIREVTGVPICFVSSGEKLEALEIFHPDRMAQRILGMGDILSLVEKAQETVDVEQAKALEKKIRKNSFDLEDLRDQLRQVKKMGSLENILGMLPGFGGQLNPGDVDPKQMPRMEAIINSMTAKERRRPLIIDGSRRRRIAAGSGTTVQEVNRLLKQFEQMQKMMKRFNKMGPKLFGKLGMRGLMGG